jgi:predicted amidophosphoribosyltransferase
MPSLWRTALLDALAVLAPTECVGCGAPDRALCDACRATLEAVAPTREALTRADGSELALWRGFDYAGTSRGILLAFKDGGRTDAAPALAGLLRRLVRAALAELPAAARGRVELAAVPSTRAAYRRRGYSQLRLLLGRAGYRDSRLLLRARETRDQAELGVVERRSNRESSLRVRPAPMPRFVVIVDDIVTTGATVLEADRAFREAGDTVLCAVALGRTERRFPPATARSKSPENTRDIVGGPD